MLCVAWWLNRDSPKNQFLVGLLWGSVGKSLSEREGGWGGVALCWAGPNSSVISLTNGIHSNLYGAHTLKTSLKGKSSVRYNVMIKFMPCLQ